jgi:hypothetical protein
VVRGFKKEWQETFWLKFHFDLSFKEIAHLKKKSINTALGEMRYMRKYLKEELT